MAEDLFRKDDLIVTAFSGGEKRGQCVQINAEHNFIQLTKSDVTLILPSLREFIGVDGKIDFSKIRTAVESLPSYGRAAGSVTVLKSDVLDILDDELYPHSSRWKVGG